MRSVTAWDAAGGDEPSVGCAPALPFLCPPSVQCDESAQADGVVGITPGKAAQSRGEHLDFRGPCGQGLGLLLLNWERELGGSSRDGMPLNPRGPARRSPEAGCAGGFPALYLGVKSI